MASPYTHEPERGGKQRDWIFAGIVLLLALTTTYLGEEDQQSISSVLRASVLRPFIATQEALTDARRRAGEIDVLTARLDTLTARLSTQASVMEENRTLRTLLELGERRAFAFVPATVLRPGTPGSENMFIVDVGSRDGVPDMAPVIGPDGLIGRIQDVREDSSVGMDWSHPDFRVSAMLEDGSAYGIVAPRFESFGEAGRLVLEGTAYSTEVLPGSTVLTSGAGGVYPRGIPIGRIDELREAGGTWRKSYWIRPMVETGAVTHVLVLTNGGEGEVSSAWTGAEGDTIGQAPGS